MHVLEAGVDRRQVEELIKENQGEGWKEGGRCLRYQRFLDPIRQPIRVLCHSKQQAEVEQEEDERMWNLAAARGEQAFRTRSCWQGLRNDDPLPGRLQS